MKKLCTLLSILLSISKSYSQTQPPQPTTGYGSSAYPYDSVIKINDDSGLASGFWIYLPASPALDSAPVVVFDHGYGAWNPDGYGGWINHIVRRGNIVIFPRFQVDLLTPASEYTDSAAFAIHKALDTLAAHPGYTQPILSKFFIAGHSYGGVVTANLAYNYQLYNFPEPKAILLACPGTGGVNSGRLTSYKNMPADINILTMAEVDDNVVDSSFALEIFDSTILVPYSHKNFIFHHPDSSGTPPVGSAHGQCGSNDSAYDSGATGPIITAFTATNVTDVTDYYCYWKLLDALIDCAGNGVGCNVAFGDTYAQKYMGTWSDSVPIVPLEVRPAVPDTTTGLAKVDSSPLQLSLFPNPASGKFFLSATQNIEAYIIYNPQGQEISRRESIKAQQSSINVDGWAQGIYILQAIIGQQKVTRSFTVVE